MRKQFQKRITQIVEWRRERTLRPSYAKNGYIRTRKAQSE